MQETVVKKQEEKIEQKIYPKEAKADIKLDDINLI